LEGHHRAFPRYAVATHRRMVLCDCWRPFRWRLLRRLCHLSPLRQVENWRVSNSGIRMGAVRFSSLGGLRRSRHHYNHGTGFLDGVLPLRGNFVLVGIEMCAAERKRGERKRGTEKGTLLIIGTEKRNGKGDITDNRKTESETGGVDARTPEISDVPFSVPPFLSLSPFLSPNSWLLVRRMSRLGA